jgi:DNA-directed RNA polymerase subunit M
MRFCPECQARLKPSGDDVVVCPKCGYKDRKKGSSEGKSVTEVKQVSGSNASLKVMDPDEKQEEVSTINIDCPKCGNDTAEWWMQQTRSADEATTRFYRCTKCKHTWRDYS